MVKATSPAIQDLITRLYVWLNLIQPLAPNQVDHTRQWFDDKGIDLLTAACIVAEPKAVAMAAMGLSRLGLLILDEMVTTEDAERFCDWVLNVPSMLATRLAAMQQTR